MYILETCDLYLMMNSNIFVNFLPFKGSAYKLGQDIAPTIFVVKVPFKFKAKFPRFLSNLDINMIVDNKHVE